MKQVDINREDLNKHLFESYVPSQAQRFISHANFYAENYRLSIMVVKGAQVFIYKYGDDSGEPIFRYTANDGFYDEGNFKSFQFKLDGNWYEITAFPNSCELTVSGDEELRLGTIENDEVTFDKLTLDEFTDRLTEFFNEELLVDGAVTE